MYTSKNSQLHDRIWPERRHWLVAAGFGFALLVALHWVSMAGDGSPELRLAATYQAVTAQIVDGDNRILILNANGPRDARSVIGRLNRPWESKPSTVIVGADRDNAEALWESIQRLDPRQIVVAGAPGDSDAWSTIERHARANAIEISYLNAVTTIELDTLTIRIHPPVEGSTDAIPSFVEIDLSESRVAVGLAGLPPQGRYHVVVSGGEPASGLWGDLVVSTENVPVNSPRRSIVLESGDRIDTRLGRDRIEISGRPARSIQLP